MECEERSNTQQCLADVEYFAVNADNKHRVFNRNEVNKIIKKNTNSVFCSVLQLMKV
jgi:hypothetical protein